MVSFSFTLYEHKNNSLYTALKATDKNGKIVKRWHYAPSHCLGLYVNVMPSKNLLWFLLFWSVVPTLKRYTIREWRLRKSLLYTRIISRLRWLGWSGSGQSKGREPTRDTDSMMRLSQIPWERSEIHGTPSLTAVVRCSIDAESMWWHVLDPALDKTYRIGYISDGLFLDCCQYRRC